MGIFLVLKRLNYMQTLKVPAVLPPIVANTIIQAGYQPHFIDDTNWIGNSYTIKQIQTHDFTIIDSAQRVERDQFSRECLPQDVAIFSFYPTKPIGSIDGGIVVSDDADAIDWIRRASLYGTGGGHHSWEREAHFIGWKAYMNTAQAMVAFHSLRYWDYRKQALLAVRDHYNEVFDYKRTSDHLYVVNVSDRDQVMKELRDKDIECGIHYKSLSDNALYKPYQRDDLKNSAWWSKTCLSIPFHAKLTLSDVNKIVKIVKPYVIKTPDNQ
jgi:dTDP-4-amino-4,6-dideoxygalactose transaminase